ncbi:hypothetical protein [Chloroflexus sp.]|uniref:hypothetical protein n=1 Tax=Chloroflexus sp. TaxID=1904827 RepID=UPI002634FC67|nr:hypothetical protein [uncultured Chloroflexus sp.]
MKRFGMLMIGILMGGLAVGLVVMTVAPVFAQGPVGPQPTPAAGSYGTMSATRAGRDGWMQQGNPGSAMAQRGGWAGSNASLAGVAAAELGLSQQELINRLNASGGSIADELKAAGIDPQVVAQKFVASRAERLEAAVAAGRITREQADAQLALAQSMTLARLMQPFTPLGPGGLRPDNAPVQPDQCQPAAVNGYRGGRGGPQR